MTTAIAEKLNEYLITLPWIDRLAGIVKPLTFTNANGNENTFPVACNKTYEDCLKSSVYMDLVPDSKKKCIIYFEDQGTTFGDYTGRYQEAESNMRLVCWINIGRFGAANCSFSSQVMQNIIATIPINPTPTNAFDKLTVVFKDEVPKTPAIFSVYNYSETNNQYLIYPFDYFALNLTVTYRINRECVLPLTPTTPLCY